MLTGIAAFAAGQARGAEEERARIVAWLRAPGTQEGLAAITWNIVKQTVPIP